ncbi:MAG: ABC transporter ATP-binding protein, partial [Betaproteobacteria bacterium]
LVEYAGGYADWRRAKQFHADSLRDDVRADTRAQKVASQPSARSAPPAKLSFKETRELTGLPEKIAALEQEQGVTTQRLADGTLYRSDPAQAQALQKKLVQIEADLATCLARWEELESRAPATPAPVK